MDYKGNKNNTQADTSKPNPNTTDDDVFAPVSLTLVTESLHPQPENIAVRKNNDK